MGVDLQTIKVWSKEDQAIVDWDVTLETVQPVQADIVQEEPPRVLIVKHNNEIYRFSPNITDDELIAQIQIINQEKK